MEVTHISDVVLPSLAARRHSRHCRDPPPPSRETVLKVSEGVRAYIPLCWWAWPAAGLGGAEDWPKDKSFSRVAQKESPAQGVGYVVLPPGLWVAGFALRWLGF